MKYFKYSHKYSNKCGVSNGLNWGSLSIFVINSVKGGIILLINLLDTEVFGYNYLSKFEIDDSIIKIDSNIKKRSKKLSNNIVRGRYKWKRLLY